jgi:hypothetical protein
MAGGMLWCHLWLYASVLGDARSRTDVSWIEQFVIFCLYPIIELRSVASTLFCWTLIIRLTKQAVTRCEMFGTTDYSGGV